MIRGILLAGGASTRFGSQKLLHRLPSGRTIGEQSAMHLVQGCGNVLAVVRPDSDELKKLLIGAGCEVLDTEDALQGMGSSLSAAVRASDDASGWVVALADMPFILPATIAAVHRRLTQGASIVIPVVEGERGHPVGFAFHWRDALSLLTGDAGARGVIQRHAKDVSEIAVKDPNIRRDVDKPSDAMQPS